MSGHNKWQQIRHKKAITDKKRGQLFTKHLKAISIAARDNPDPEFNHKLRSAIEKAQRENVPKDNIERAIKKSSEDKNLEEIIIESYGPEKSAFIIRAITDNRNRTIAEIKKILSDNNAKMAEQGSVLWSFNRIKDGSFVPKFNQPVSDETRMKIKKNIEALEGHDDVQEVITNI